MCILTPKGDFLMKLKTKQQRINDAMRLLDRSYNIKKNVIKINTTNTLEHEMAKLKVVYDWISRGYDVYTEVIFKNNKGRADIFIPFLFRVIEILHSESKKEFLNKVLKYPDEVEIMHYTTEEVLK